MTPRLVGRAAELDELRRRLSSESRAVVIRGSAGVGKSHLGRQFATDAARTGHPVLRVAASRNSTEVPLGCLSHLIAERIVTSSADLVHVATATILGRAQGRRRLVILFDDIQHADRATLTVIEQVLRASNAFVTATERTDDDGAGTRLAEPDIVHRLLLRPLPDSDMTALIEDLLGGPVDAVTQRQLLHLASGLPLYLRELVQETRSSGTLERRGGSWHLRGRLEPSARLVDIVGERIGTLAPEQRTALDVVCVADPAPLAVVEQLVDHDAIEFLERRALIRLEDDSRGVAVVPAHPLHGEVVRTQLTPLRRRRLARRLSAAYSRLQHSPADVMKRALLHLEAAVGPDVALLDAAAARAAACGDHRLALRIADAALAAGAGVRTAIVAAEAAHALGDGAGASRRYAEASKLANTDDDHVAVVISEAFGRLYAGDGSGAHEIVSAGVEVAIGSHAAAALTVAEAEIAGYAGRWHSARSMAASVRGDALPARTRFAARVIEAYAATFAGPHPDAATSSNEARALLVDVEHPRPTHVQWLDVGDTYRMAVTGDPDGAIAACIARTQQSIEGRAHRDFAGVWSLGVGLTSLLVGSVTTHAVNYIESAVRLMRHRDVGDLYSFAVAAAATIAAMRGDIQRAVALARHYDADLRGVEQKTTGLADRAASWIAVRRVGPATAIAHARAGVRELLRNAAPLFAAGVLHDVVRFGAPTLVAAQLDDVARELESPVVSLMAEHATALAGRDADRLEDVARRFELLGCNQLAAEALVQLGSMRHTRAHRASVLRLTEQELVRLDHVGPDARTSPPWPGLTERQRQVAFLAADGLTTPQIAERLVLSPRTVSNHLGAVYRELGVASRDELRALVASGEGREVESDPER